MLTLILWGPLRDSPGHIRHVYVSIRDYHSRLFSHKVIAIPALACKDHGQDPDMVAFSL